MSIEGGQNSTTSVSTRVGGGIGAGNDGVNEGCGPCWERKEIIV